MERALDRVEQHNLNEIEALNQRGGRTLSIVDLMHAGTITPEAAGFALWRIAHGASFLTGAVPGGAGKTTLLADLLGMLPPGERIVTTPDGASVREALADTDRRGRCYLCHEFGSGSWYGYLWGRTVAEFFGLRERGGRIAGCLHADDPEQMRAILLSPALGVTPEAFVGIELLLFMAISRGSTGLVRRAASVWVADGRAGHEAVFLRDPRSDTLRRTEAPAPAEDGSAPTLDACERSMRQLAERKAVLFEEARRATLAFYEDAAEP